MSEQVHECSKGWASRCASAKRTRCTCACGGHNHGASRQDREQRAQVAPSLLERLGRADLDTIHEYGGNFGCESRCRIRIYRNGPVPVVVATELDDNPGTSITNAAEQVAALVGRAAA